MWNATIYGTHDLVDRFVSALEEIGPRDSAHGVSLQKPASGDTADAIILWQIAGRTVEIAVTTLVSPPIIVPTRPPATGDGKKIRILLAPFISRPMQEQLVRAGMSYWDPTGNLLLHSRDPFIWVKQDGAMKNPHPETISTALRSLKGRAASEVVVRLLSGGRAESVRDLARDSGISLGTVSRVVTLLRDEDLLESGDGGPILVRDPHRLARRWAEDYTVTKTFKATRYFSILGTDSALARIRGSGVNYALTGLTAQALWYEAESRVAPLPGSELWLYTDDVDRIVTVADLVPDRANGTIVVAHADFFGPGREGYRLVGDTRIAQPWRIVGDLMSLSGRPAAAGTDFAEQLIEKKAGPNA